MSDDTNPNDFESGLTPLCLLAVHLRRGTYDPTLAVSAWVIAIARHKQVDLWRRRGRREALHDVLDDVWCKSARMAQAGAVPN
jgi:DNA-directed RNA polymerase specialized sigma24 family protein